MAMAGANWLTLHLKVLSKVFISETQDPHPNSLDETPRCATQMGPDGLPIVPLSPLMALGTRLRKSLLYLVVMPLIGPPMIAVLWFKRRNDFEELYSVVKKADRNPVKKRPFFQDTKLLAKLWRKTSAKKYIVNGALEFQKTEGYCGRTTLRCVLMSMGDFPAGLIPKQEAGPNVPEEWCSSLQKILERSNKFRIRATVIGGKSSYENFLSALRKVEDEKCRLVVNYLRPALLGFPSPRWTPTSFLMGLFAGHFTPIVGILEDSQEHKGDPLVGIFDVNHKYGGAYLVPASDLYESVRACDVMSGKSRALILLEMS